MNEEFEKWFAEEFGYEPAREMKHWPSWNRSRDFARIAWQASRKQAIEECAVICERVPGEYDVHSNFIGARKIRALQQ